MKKRINYNFDSLIAKPKDTLVFAICCVLFYAIGAIAASQLTFGSYLCRYVCIEFDGRQSFDHYFIGWLFCFIPQLHLYLCGYSYLGSLFALFIVAIRAFLSGFAAFSSVSSFLALSFGKFLFCFYSLLEGMVLLTVVSSAVEQKRFRSCYSLAGISPFKTGINKLYGTNFLFRVGILFIIFIIRTLIFTPVV